MTVSRATSRTDIPTAGGAREKLVSNLLVGAVDLHCHSGPAIMPRVLDHHEQLLEAASAGFRAVVTKDHYYLGTPHALILEKLNPGVATRIYSGIALNNAVGGINPHAVDHALKLGARIVWMPTVSAANHIAKAATEAKSFPSASTALAPIPLSVLGADETLTDDALRVLDLVAAEDAILAGGHLGANELIALFAEGRRRGVTKMIVNHPTYVVGCSNDDIKTLVELGAKMEHSICQFIPGRAQKFEPEFLAQLIEVAGVENTLFGSDLGLIGLPRPVEGYTIMANILLDLGYSEEDIRTMTGRNGRDLLNMSGD